MKRIVTLTLLLASASAFAQEPHGRQMRMLFEDLDLTSAQKTQLKTIRKETRNERIKLTDQLEDLREKTDERVMAVLTEAQKKQFIEARKAMHKERICMRCDRDKMPRHTPR